MILPQDAWVRALANLSSAFLLTGLFGLLISMSALLWLSARALNGARAGVKVWAPQVLAWLLSLQLRLDTEARQRIVGPHVTLLSGWRGLKAGAAALLHGSRAAGR